MHFLSYPSSLSNFVRVHAVCRGGFQPGSFRFFRLGLLPPPPPPRIEHHESRPPRHYFPLSLSLLRRRPLEGCRWPLAMKTRLPVRRPRSVRGSGLAGGGQKWHLRAREISWTASARGLPPSEVTRQSQTIVVHLAGGEPRMYSSGNKICKILDTLANSTSPPPSLVRSLGWLKGRMEKYWLPFSRFYSPSSAARTPV